MSVRSFCYLIAKYLGDLSSVQKALTKGSVKPLVKRFVNKQIGRHIVSKLWWR